MKYAKKLIIVFATVACLTTATVTAQFTAQKIPDQQIMTDRKLFKRPPGDFGIPVQKVGFPNAVNQGILSCQPGGPMGIIAKCVVRNMPLLLQTDPRLDPDVKELGPTGCYDTSLATVMLTALADRTSTQPLTGRTKLLSEVKGERPIPKSIKQLSWVYRRAKEMANGVKDKNGKPIQALYLSEVLADIGKIKENCDPFTFANCTSASSQFGHSFYEFADQETNWTNDFFIKKMREGFVILFAYARFKPFVVVENNQKVVKFTPAGLHKVVFSGFQIGNKYPLLINDVGNGKQFRVRIGTDLSVRKFGLSGSKDGQTFNESAFVAHPAIKTTLFLEYEDMANGVNDEVQFAHHIDLLKLK